MCIYVYSMKLTSGFGRKVIIWNKPYVSKLVVQSFECLANGERYRTIGILDDDAWFIRVYNEHEF